MYYNDFQKFHIRSTVSYRMGSVFVSLPVTKSRSAGQHLSAAQRRDTTWFEPRSRNRITWIWVLMICVHPH
jgi:hypothetical protein